MLAQNGSSIPRGGGVVRGNQGAVRGGHAPSQGTQSQQTSSVTDQSARGGGLPRGGRGRGQGRGQPQNIQTANAPTTQSLGSPAAGRGMNAGAKQFVPSGVKRQREDGTTTPDSASAGKKPRGGGGGN
jgi:nucleoprotein TPR